MLTTNLDHLRWAAAMMVVVQHTRGFVLKDYSPAAGLFAKAVYFATGFSHDAVVIFFVISGYLVGGKALRMLRQGVGPTAAQRYLIDRFSRIFIVLLPALALTALVALVAPDAPLLRSDTWVVGLANVRESTTPEAWLAAPFLLNELLAPSLQWDNPLWSLAFEWTYYIIVAAALFAAARRSARLWPLVVAYALVLIGLSLWHRPMLLAMFPFWLAGAFASQVKRLRLPWLTIPLLLVALLASRIQVLPWAQDAFVAAAAALLLADNWFREKQPAPRVGQELASFSFSLYAIHFPVLLLALAVMQSRGLLPARMDAGPQAYGIVIGLTAIIYAVAWGFGRATERQTHRLRSLLNRLFLDRRAHMPPPDEPVSAELENVAPLATPEASGLRSR